MTNWPWLPLPVQWLARFGIYPSHPQAARRRSSAAGCSPPRRCPKPEFGSFEGGLGLFCESLNGEQGPRGGSSDTTWIWTEWGFLGCWTLMCWEGWRGRRVVIPKLSVPSFGLAPCSSHTAPIPQTLNCTQFFTRPNSPEKHHSTEIQFTMGSFEGLRCLWKFENLSNLKFYASELVERGQLAIWLNQAISLTH